MIVAKVANTASWARVTAAKAADSARAGVARPDSSPRRISSGKIDSSTPWTSWYKVRQRVIVPKISTNDWGSWSGGDTRSRRLDLTGQVAAVVRFQVVKGPFDDDPTEFAKQFLQAGLEAMAGLGREGGPAEGDDEATDLGDQRTSRTVKADKDVAKCVVRRGAANVGWSIGVSFSVEEQRVFDPVTSQKRHLDFQVTSGPSRPTQATSRSKIIKAWLRIMALAKIAPSSRTMAR